MYIGILQNVRYWQEQVKIILAMKGMRWKLVRVTNTEDTEQYRPTSSRAYVKQYTLVYGKGEKGNPK